MSEDSVRFSIPGTFVAEHARLTPKELVYGYRGGWLAGEGVVVVALTAWEAGEPLSCAEEDLALLLSDELGRVPQLIDDLDRSSAHEDDAGAVWLFLALAWLHERRPADLDVWESIEMLYADFGYPKEIEGLVRFMPLAPGLASGKDAIEGRWVEYLRGKSAHYLARRHRSV
jgi:hypothetical protein